MSRTHTLTSRYEGALLSHDVGSVIETFVFDFDGTLAHRPGMWSQCLLEVLDHHEPAHEASIEDLRLRLRDGFPWHRPNDPHSFESPDKWWEALSPVLENAFVSAGVPQERLPQLASAVRELWCDASRFVLYPDTLPALRLVEETGRRSVILSNNVPELPKIVDALGLSEVVDEVVTSALIGYEKPHPRAFEVALGTTPPELACMVGDNPVADVQGARAVGMHAVLVRHQSAPGVDVLAAVRTAGGRQQQA